MTEAISAHTVGVIWFYEKNIIRGGDGDEFTAKAGDGVNHYCAGYLRLFGYPKPALKT